MTTTVTVKAHCDSKTTKVQIKTNDTTNPQPDIFIEDGEEIDVVVFDERTVTVNEVPK
jgi:hypothetical protein